MRKSQLFLWAVALFLVFAAFQSNAQDPSRFDEKIKELTEAEYNFDPAKELVVFTGSSSVLRWYDVPSYFPDYNVINNGFGGSHFSDMLHFYKEVIVKPQPEILFIYEGDNDIANKKDPKAVFKEAKTLAKWIKRDLPDTKVIFISAKPSVRRAGFDEQYKDLNRRIKRYTRCRKQFDYADVWSAMMGEDGKVRPDLFIEDNLHMNKTGYDIWGEVMREFLP
jgi:lysophospholipase L1-like esterase